MHFNDLLMRLRSQGLAGVAAISTLVGIFTKSETSSLSVDWLIATCLFTAASLFWVAIWCLDFLYYNRLLLGAVSGLRTLEQQTQNGQWPIHINMSTLIEAEFQRRLTFDDLLRFRGVLLFYVIVFVALVAGTCISVYEFLGGP